MTNHKQQNNGSSTGFIRWESAYITAGLSVFLLLACTTFRLWQENTLYMSQIQNLKQEVLNFEHEMEPLKGQNEKYSELIVQLLTQKNITFDKVAPFLQEPVLNDIRTKVEAAEPKLTYPIDLRSQYFPSGWMGDGESGEQYLTFNSISESVDGEDVIADRIEYHKGSKGWAGIYWQYPDNNWGDKPGRDLTGAKTVSFDARGERGNEIVEFKAGGINTAGKQYKDSFAASPGKTKLSKTWKHYEIDISQADLSNVMGAFAWDAASTDNTDPVIVYIANLVINK